MGFNKSEQGSMELEMIDNPEMAKHAWARRLQYAGDQKSMEDWAKDGFVSSGMRDHDITEGDHRQTRE